MNLSNVALSDILLAAGSGSTIAAVVVIRVSRWWAPVIGTWLEHREKTKQTRERETTRRWEIAARHDVDRARVDSDVRVARQTRGRLPAPRARPEDDHGSGGG